MTVGDLTVVGKLTFAIDQARNRFLEASREFAEGPADGAMERIAGSNQRLRLQVPENRRQAAFEEYQRARQNLEQYLTTDAKGISSEENS
jgi:hypothetical protein